MRSSSAWAAAKNVVAVAEGHRAGDQREAQVEQRGDRRDRPPDEAAGALPLVGRRLGGRRAGAGGDGGARRLGLEAAAAPARAGAPSGSTITWPMWPALPSAPSSSRPSSTMPPPTPVDTTMARSRARPGAAPRQPSPERERLGVVVDVHRQAERLGQAAPQRELPPAGDVERRHALAAAGHRPAGADAARHLVARCATSAASAEQGGRAPASPSRAPGVGQARAGEQRAVGVDHAGGQLRATDVEGEHRVHRRPEPIATAPRRQSDGVSAYPVPAAHRHAEEHQVAISQQTPATEPPFADHHAAVLDNIERVIQGKPEVIELVLLCLVSEGHLLIEDVPGVGKTSLAKALAASIDGTFGRLQFTPDLLPTDVVGRHGVEPQHQRVRVPARARSSPTSCWPTRSTGPRPKTQSALLEAMAEAQVTVDGTTYPLASPFMVIATQNPIEHEGTYPLPESQLDRFLMRVSVGYPSTESELQILDTHGDHDALDDIGSVITAADVRALSDAAKAVHVAPALKAYLVELANASRRHPHLALGMSPRATLAPAARRAGPGRRQRPHLRGARRPQGAGRAGARPPAARHPRGAAAGDLRRRRAHRGAAAVPDPRRQGAVSPSVLTRQGWLVGVGAGALLLAGRVLGLVELFALGVVAAALLVGRVRARQPPRASSSRWAAAVHPARVHVGTSSRVDLTIRNLRATGTPVLRLRDPVSGTRGADLLVPPLGRGERTVAAYRLPTDRRGLVQIGPLEVVVGDPFGLDQPRHRRRAHASSSPSTRTSTRSTRSPTPPATTRSPAPRQPNSLGRTGEDFYALRPYVVGDDLRRIHWPSSARHDELLVRQNELPWQGRTTVLLDVRKAAHAGESLEVAVSAAASIVAATARRNDLDAAGHHRRHRLGLRARLRPRRGDHGAPGGGAAGADREPAPLGRDARPAVHRRGARGDRRRGAGGRPAGRRAPARPLRLAHDRAHRPLRLGPGGPVGPAPEVPALRVTRDSPFATGWNTYVRTSTRRGRATVGAAR